MTDETPRGVQLTHYHADLGDVRLHYVEAGEGPLVLLLHGFPQFWYQWRHQIPALVEAGFRVVAPDMRGYNLSDKPHGVRAYRIELLARDVERLILACGERTASVVGHDWGAIVAWTVAMRLPGRVGKLAILNVPGQRPIHVHQLTVCSSQCRPSRRIRRHRPDPFADR